MAEESMKNKGGAAKFSTSLSKGLNKDVSPETQLEGTYRWALNAVSESEEGNIGFLTNEEGNYICGQIDPEWVIIGHIYIGEDEAVIFQAPKDTSLSSSHFQWGRISRIKADCSIVNIITTNCLNFNVSHQIQATFRIRKGCEITIYWTDDYNKVGSINIDALEDYLAEGQESYIADNPTTYMNDAEDSFGNSIWDCDKLNIFPKFSLPCIEYVRTDTAGTLMSGVYQFAIQYLDQDLNETRWTSITQPIPIYKDSFINADSILGDHPSQVNPDGTVDFSQTNKSIVLNFTNLDLSYTYIRVAVIPSTYGIGAPAGAYIVDTFSYGEVSHEYHFDSFSQEEVTLISLDQITIPRQTFQKAKTITQIENKLILGNVDDISLDHTEITKAALDIQVTYVTRELDTNDPGGQYGGENAQSGRYYFDYRSYMRDEIYAFGIVWIFKDGTESPVYHIPGRTINEKADGTPMITGAGEDPNVPHAPGYVQAQHNRELPIGTDWDSTAIDQLNNMNTDHYTPDSTGVIQRWEVYNTAVRESVDIGYTLPGAAPAEERKLTRGQLSYFECRNIRYPDVRDCDGVPVFPHTGDGIGTPYEMEKVRHHKMPDTTLEPHFYGANNIGGISGVQAMGDNPHDQYNMYGKSYIISLGIEVENVKIPESIALDVQGYRIVKALANEGDKTVIDKGIMFNIHYAFNSWNGCKKDTDIPTCAYAFQGNRFNKQLGEFACNHVPSGGPVIMAKFNENYDCAEEVPSPQGRGNIASDNYYCQEFGTSKLPYGGYVLRHEPTGTSNCIATNDSTTDEQSFMAPLIVNHEWQRWWGSHIVQDWGNPIDQAINNIGWLYHPTGIDRLMSPSGGLPGSAYPGSLATGSPLFPYTIPCTFEFINGGAAPEKIHDRIDRGVGYPLGNWGWYQSPEVGSPTVYDLNTEDSDGVNIGYDTNVMAYPNSPMGYHGPMSKFKSVESATYIKTERVLIGYTKNIICNNACCNNDAARDNNPAVMDGVGGEINPDRHDGGSDDPNGTTYMYTKMSYFQSAVQYSNIKDAWDPANKMQWERWASPCDYDSWVAAPAEWITHRGQSIWTNQSDRYDKPLQNVRLTGTVKIDAFTEKVVGIEPLLGYTSFSNHSQQEVLLMGSSWEITNSTDPLVYWAWPWPGNNYSRGGEVPGYENYTRIPFDHAYSRFNCAQLYDRWENTTGDNAYAMPLGDPVGAITGPPEQMDPSDPYYDQWYNPDGSVYTKPLNGAGTAYYVSLKKPSYDAYGSPFNLTYTLSHNCMISADADTPGLISSAEELYGGDSFISRFAFKQTQEGMKSSQEVHGSGDNQCAAGGSHGFAIQPLNRTGPMFNTWSPNIIPIPPLVASAPFPWFLPPDAYYGAERDLNGDAFENIGNEAESLFFHANFNHIVQYWTESYINTELRLRGVDPMNESEMVYPRDFEGVDALQGVLAFVDCARVQDEGIPYATFNDPENTQCPNYYALNEDYNKAAVESTFAPLPLQFDYCQDCANKHPHRIAYSETSIDGEQSDAFRNFLTGNFRDIPGNRGEVWNVWVSNNALYIHTAESLWRVDPSRNMVQPEGDEAAIYIGTGAFFSSPAKEIAQSELGYLGSRSQWATMLTETGTIWPDEQQGHIYMQQEGPGDIGNKGMKAWFESNMPINMYSQYREIYGVDFPFIDNPANPVGAGYTAVFDSEYKRYIITKKDYKLIGDFTIPGNPFYGAIELDPLLNEWVITTSTCNCPHNPEWVALADPASYNTLAEGGQCKHTWTSDGTLFTQYWPCEYSKLTGNDSSIICSTCGDNDLISPITIEGDPGAGEPPTKVITNLNEVFECNSWTISYSLAPESWTSFHSYMPTYYIGMRHYFYTTIPQDVSLYRHELNSVRRNYQTFYGCTHPFIVDFVNNDGPLNVNLYDSIRYYTNVSYYDSVTGEYVDDRYTTFERAWLYNSYQTTGELTLKVKDEDVESMMSMAVDQVEQQSLLKRKDRIWFLNHFRDIAKDRTQSSVPSLFTNSWADLQTTPYIDKVINPLAINNAKAWYTTQPLKDRYLQVRLFFDNLAGIPGRYKITTNFILGSAQQSFR